MLKKLLFPAFSMIVMHGVAQTKDSVISETKTAGTWQNSSLYISFYDANCRLIRDTSKNWDSFSQSWVPASYTNFKYDDNSNLLESISWYFDTYAQQWTRSSRAFTNSKIGPISITNLFQTWDANSKAWVNAFKSTYISDTILRRNSYEYENYIDNAWQKSGRSYDLFDNSNRPLQSVYQAGQNNEWVNSSRTINKYDANGAKGRSHDYLWNITDQKWTYFRRNLLELIPGTSSTTKTLLQLLTSDVWENVYRTSSVYNSNNLITYGTSESYAFNAWQPNEREYHDYYADNSLQHLMFEFWDGSTNTYASGVRLTFSNYHCNTGAKLIVSNQFGDQPVIFEKSKKQSVDLNLTETNNSQVVFDLNVLNQQAIVANHSISYKLVIPVHPSKAVSSKSADNIITSSNNGFTISPNPAKNYITVSTSKKLSGTQILTITDAQGKTVLQKTLVNIGTQKISLPAIQQGMYFVTIRSGKEFFSQKLIVQ